MQGNYTMLEFYEGKIVLWISNREWIRESFSPKSQFQVSCADLIITTGAYIGVFEHSYCAVSSVRRLCPASSGQVSTSCTTTTRLSFPDSFCKETRF